MAGVELLDLYEIVCFQCGRRFQVCVADYRGHRYCLEGDCRKLGYRARARERGRRYQGTDNGRTNHRDRQQRQRDEVRDGNACPSLLHAVQSSDPEPDQSPGSASDQPPSPEDSGLDFLIPLA